jgi:hypothetical protein
MEGFYWGVSHYIALTMHRQTSLSRISEKSEKTKHSKNNNYSKQHHEQTPVQFTSANGTYIYQSYSRFCRFMDCVSV